MAAHDTVRVFYAVWPDAAAREAIEHLALGLATETRGRAPRPNNLHLTLALVGSVLRARVDDLIRVGDSVAASAAPFSLTFDRVDAFRGTGIAWLGASRIPVELKELVDSLRRRLAAEGLANDSQAFRAHVTLARRCQRTPRRRDVMPLSWHCDAFTLTSSVPQPTGSVYSDIARHALAAR